MVIIKNENQIFQYEYINTIATILTCLLINQKYRLI